MMFNTNTPWYRVSTYCFLTAITFQSIPCAKCNILDKYPEDINYLNLISCRTFCGTHTTVCSCQSQCRVLYNCCEDFKQECPEEYNNTERIEHLLHASVGCYYDTLMVDELPPRVSNQTTNSLFITTASTQKDTMKLDSIFRKAPVIDLYNGIVFKNRNIYKYYSLIESQPVSWSPIIQFILELPFTSFVEYIAHVDRYNVAEYRLPTIVNSSDTCIVSALKCPNSSSRHDIYLTELCNDFITYIYDREQDRYYRNAYCKMCQNDTDDSFDIVVANRTINDKKKQKNFAVIVRTTNTGFSFTVDKEQSLTENVNWQEIDCGTKTSSLGTSCSISSCPKTVLKFTSDRRCGYERRLQIAIASNEVDLGAEYDLLELSSIFWCLLKSRSKRIFLEDDQTSLGRPIKIFHSEVNMFSYMLEANVLWPQMNYDYHVKAINTVIDAIVKALSHHAKNKANADAKVNKETRDEQLLHTDDAITFDLDSDLMSNIVSFQIKENNKWYIDTIVTDEDPIALSCMCVKSRNVTTICSRRCWQTPTFQQDERNIRQLLNSVCFQSGSCCNDLSLTVTWLQIVCTLTLIELI